MRSASSKHVEFQPMISANTIVRRPRLVAVTACLKHERVVPSRVATALVLGIMLSAATTADAQSTFFGTFNGHDYYTTDAAVTIPLARVEANALATNLAAPAHLVTVNNQEEQDWLNLQLGFATAYWIGFSDDDSNEVFEWDSGQPTTFTFWTPGEPSDQSGVEDWTMMNWNASGQWNDVIDTVTISAIIEVVPFVDCNGNGIADACDLHCGVSGGACDVLGCGGSADCNANGIPDECEDMSVVFVDSNATGIGDGTSWANAFTSLQDALSTAACLNPATTQIWVVAGTYTPDDGVGHVPGDRDATFQLVDGVALFGGFNGTEVLLNQRDVRLNSTTLSGDLSENDNPADFPDGPTLNENSRRLVTGSGTGPTALLDGFTVTAGNADQGQSGHGAGIFNQSGSPTIQNCTIIRNSARFNGGGVYNLQGSSPTVVNCKITGNHAEENGGGMCMQQNSHPTMTNCTFNENSAARGGGIYTATIGISPTVTNCIFWDNSDNGGMDQSAQIHSAGTIPIVNYSIVQGGWSGAGGVGIINADPRFVNPDGPDGFPGTEDDDLRLISGSPAIDAASNASVPADTEDLDNDGNTTEPIPIDLNGNDRFVDDPTAVDCVQAPGTCGTAPIVDMGAYEFNPVIFVDTNANGANDGSSWTDAYSRLQDALTDAGGSLRDIWVAAGTYRPDRNATNPNGTCTPDPCDRAATFQLISGVAIYGGFAGGETSLSQRNVAANETILSGDLLGDDTPLPCVDDAECAGFGELCADDGFCIISDNNAENSYNVVTGNDTDASAVLDGFTLKTGNADDPVVGMPHSRGPAMFTDPGSPTVANCTITGNSSTSRGGIYFASSTGENPTVTNCLFQGNATLGSGGAMGILTSNPTVTDCTFRQNHAGFGGGAMFNDVGNLIMTNCTFGDNSANSAGAFSNGNSFGSPTGADAVLRDCTFVRNSTSSSGGAVKNFNVSSITLMNCLLEDNSAAFGAGLASTAGSLTTALNCSFIGNTAVNRGGGMSSSFMSSAILANCLFSGNTAGESGGGMVNNGAASDAVVSDCSFVANRADVFGGGIYGFNGGTVAASNNIFWANIEDADGDAGGPFMNMLSQINTDGGAPTVNHSIVMGGWTGAGSANIDADPLFIDTDGADDIPGTVDDNLRLLPGSPAIDAANNALVPADTQDLDNDGNTTEAIPIDLAGGPRFVDDLLTTDCAQAAGTCGVPPIVDMGAFEFFPDCNGNGLADSCDLDCGLVDGPCDLPGCGLSADCNGNSIPDECDIAACDPFVDPACDDCNLNGIPDSCDVDPIDGTSPDKNGDGIPDECANATDQGTGDWTAGTNWPLGGGYPDSDETGAPGGVPELHVTVDEPATAIFLNEDVTIDSLRILTGAVLEVSQQDTGDPNDPLDGDLTIAGPVGDLLIQNIAGLPGSPMSQLLVDNSRVIDVSAGFGDVTIGPGGVYRAITDFGDVSASLNAGSITIQGGLLGGLLQASQSMAVSSSDNLQLQIVTVGKGDSLPPCLAVTDTADVHVGGDFGIFADADVLVSSLVPVTVGGSFVNQSRDAALFDWLGGAIDLTGAAQFEVAGRDLGPIPSGFTNNFAMGTMTVATGADVTFSDLFDNDGQGQGPCTEALYVQSLTFEPGANVTLDNCRIYVESLTPNMVIPTELGCGELVNISALPLFSPRPEAFGPGACGVDDDCLNLAACIEGRCYVPKNRYVSLDAHPLNAGKMTARRIGLDTNANSSFDAGVDVVLGWMGEPTEVVVTGPEPPIQLVARVVGAPLYMDWSMAGGGGETVHLGDCHISPGRSYLIQSIEEGSDVADESSYSAALALPTVGVWGDVAGGGNPATPPDGSPNIGDIQAIVLGFQALQSAPKVWLDLEGLGNPGNVPDFGTINIADVQRAVQGFQGVAYPFSDPCTCAGLAPCP